MVKLGDFQAELQNWASSIGALMVSSGSSTRVSRSKYPSWPEDAIDVLAWYAVSDADPSEDFSKSIPDDFQVSLEIKNSVKPDPYSAGINSARRSAAEAIAHLLFARPELFQRLQDTAYSLATDSSAAVRPCAILALLASLNVAPHSAIPWFRESLANQPVLLGTPHVPRFVHYAAYRDFDGIAPVMEEMLRPSRPEVVSTAATEACLLGLDLEKPVPWVEQIERGPVTTRAAAATVYATNALALYRRRAFRSIQEFVG